MQISVIGSIKILEIKSQEMSGNFICRNIPVDHNFDIRDVAQFQYLTGFVFVKMISSTVEKIIGLIFINMALLTNAKIFSICKDSCKNLQILLKTNFIQIFIKIHSIISTTSLLHRF